VADLSPLITFYHFFIDLTGFFQWCILVIVLDLSVGRVLDHSLRSSTYR
jgi:hypothetical protein